MNTEEYYPYATFLNVLHPPLEVVSVPALVNAVTDQWYNQTLCQVNDSVVRLGVMQGEYHWHKHDDLDEFFFVLDGTFLIDLEGRTVELGARQGFVVPRSVLHRTRTCQTCGQTLCCDSSPNRHSTRHAMFSGHPVIASAEPGERWLTAKTDKAYAEY